jgi:capsular exopolysaccharide synthesis family protein
VRHLHVPLLGTICHEDEDYGLGKVDLNHVVRQAPFSVMSECYRQLKTNLKLSESASGRGALLVTSCTAGEGKTSVAVNMASSLAAEDHRVLFLDANFRRPSSHILFPHNAAEPDLQPHSDYGLSNYLMSQCDDLKEIVRKTAIEGFDVVDSGPLPDYPAELLGGERMKKLLETAGLDYDYVVIDGPPMLVSDAKMLAAVVDGTVLVCNAAMTRRGTAQRALRELRNVNATIAGTVLLGVRSLKGGYFEEVFKSYIDYQKMHVRSA